MVYNKNISKKIIAGKHKGKSIKLPLCLTTRSSKSIVLESFFNTIQFNVINCLFVEVFSGSGSVGLEALSRGAKDIIFMEMNKEALFTLKQNIKKIDSSSCEVVSGDSFLNINTVIKKIKNKNRSAYFYIDPPFSIRDGMEDIYKKMIKLINNLPTEVVEMIIIEHMSSLQLPLVIGSYKMIKIKKFGKTSLSYYMDAI